MKLYTFSVKTVLLPAKACHSFLTHRRITSHARSLLIYLLSFLGYVRHDVSRSPLSSETTEQWHRSPVVLLSPLNMTLFLNCTNSCGRDPSTSPSTPSLHQFHHLIILYQPLQQIPLESPSAKDSVESLSSHIICS